MYIFPKFDLMYPFLCVSLGSCGQRSRLWLLGSWLESVAVLHERHHPSA